jgi:DNA segregation ATPase FtsK/SpoIIIE, S-DNA-T family
MAQATRYGQLTFSDHVENALREGAMWTVMCVSVYLALSLMSYSPTDPGWSAVGESMAVSNAGGPTGAIFADIAFYLVGFFAYLLPFMLAWSAWTVFRGHGEEPTLRVWLLLLRWFGFAVVLAAGCGYLALHVGTFGLGLPNGAGGGLGMLVSTLMLEKFNAPGTDVLLTGALAVSLMLFLGFSLLRLIDQFGALVLDGLTQGGSTVMGVVSRRPPAPAPAPADAVTPAAVDTVAIAAGLPPTLKLLNPSEQPFDKKGKPRPAAAAAPPGAPPAAPLKKTEPSDSTAATAPEAVAETAAAVPPVVKTGRPPLELLTAPAAARVELSADQIEELSCAVEGHCAELEVTVRVVAVYPGPVVTLFELQLPPDLKPAKLVGILPKLALELSVASVRLVEMAPGNAVIGIEIPNHQREQIHLRALLATPEYQETLAPLAVAVGQNISGMPVVLDLARQPHLLLAGMAGAGKTTALHALLVSLLYKSGPKMLRLMLIDLHQRELTPYAEIPHLLTPLLHDPQLASRALRWCVDEMERRYRVMAKLGVRNLISYNRAIAEAQAAGALILDPTVPTTTPAEAVPRLQHLPYLVVVIAEVAEVVAATTYTVAVLAQLAQKARAAGIHLVLATAQLTPKVLTEQLCAQIPARLALQVASRAESRLILEQAGAEDLLGAGDMLYLAPNSTVPQRVHGAVIAVEEVARVTEFLRQQRSVLPALDALALPSEVLATDAAPDPLFDETVALVRATQRASLPSVQRHFKISYQRAVRLLEMLEQRGIVGAAESNGSHRVLPPPVE